MDKDRLKIVYENLDEDERAVYDLFKMVEIGDINTDQAMERLLSMVNASADDGRTPPPSE